MDNNLSTVPGATPPPRKGDRLFRADLPDWPNNACLNYAHDDQVAYAEGYRRGAQLLVDDIMEKHRDQDFLVYPIVFLYRHHVELVLKNIIRRAPYLTGRPLNSTETRHLKEHRLDSLWRDLKPMLDAVSQAARWSAPVRREMQGVDDYIRQLSALDPYSFTFRYNRSNDGDRLLPPDVTHINLRHFSEMMERLAAYLDGLDTATMHLEVDKREWEGEQSREMAEYMGYA